MKTQYKTSILNPDYSFENYYMTDNSQTIIDEIFSRIESDKRKHHPIFIHGSYGTGKTHLLQAIAQKHSGGHSKRKASYFTCEEFVDNIINAICEKKFKAFKRGLGRDIDILLIDDAHILEDKQYTQEVVLSILDIFYSQRKIAIISADRPPSELFRLSNVSFGAWQFKTYELKPSDEVILAMYVKREGQRLGLDAGSITDLGRDDAIDFRKIRSLINTAFFKKRCIQSYH